MNFDLSFLELIKAASMPVQMVMLLLLFLSLASWSLIFQRYMLNRKFKQFSKTFENDFWSGTDLTKVFENANAKKANCQGLEYIFRAGFREFLRLRKQGTLTPGAVMEGSQRAMRVALAKEQAKLESGISFLATVGSTSPYIGLFGTVWGIMNSFHQLGQVQQATLAMVAPGISEALVATSMGLLAAIPAVIAYNRFTNTIDVLLKSYDTFIEEFSTILHRKAHSPA